MQPKTAGRPAILILGFTHGSQAQTKAWGARVGRRFPAWSIAVLEDVPRLVRGMVSHSIKSSIPKEQYGHFVLVLHGEKELKQAAGFDRPDDAYLLLIDASGRIQWSCHGAPTDAAIDEIARRLAPPQFARLQQQKGRPLRVALESHKPLE